MDHEAELRRLKTARHRAEEHAEKIRQQARAAILAALADGMTQTEVARLSGYTRERVRLFTKEANR